MFSRREDPDLNVVLARLNTVHTLIQCQIQHTPPSDQRFYLEAFADLLNKTQNYLPKLYSLSESYEKGRIHAVLSSPNIQTENQHSLNHFDLVVELLTQIQHTAIAQREQLRRFKNQMITYSLLGGCGAFAGLILQSTLQTGLKYLLTGVIIPTATMISLVKVALFCAGLILIGGLGFALYAYMQEHFCAQVIKNLGHIRYTQVEQGHGRAQSLAEAMETGKPYVATFTNLNFTQFFQNQRSVLESVFTPANQQRAGIVM